MDINYYRTFIFYLIKIIVYNHVINKYTVYSSKNTKVVKLININQVINNINDAGYTNIQIFIDNLENNIKKNFDLFILK